MKLRLRKFTILLSGMGMVAMGFSGIVLLISPPADIALWNGWRFMGMDQSQWLNLLMLSATITILSLAIYMIFNVKQTILFIRELDALELSLGAGFMFLLIAGTYMNLSQFTWPLKILDSINNVKGASTNIPTKSFQLMTVEELCSYGGINAACCLSLLTEKGIQIESPQMTISQLVRKSRRSVKEIFKILEPHMKGRAGTTNGAER